MPETEGIALSKLEPGKSGEVIDIAGGFGLKNRLAALGIRPGRKITKLSSMFMRGPVTVQVDRSRVAIGYGMARKIIVKPKI